MKKESCVIYGTLNVQHVNGRNGLFPIGTLKSAIGIFRVRNTRWIERFDNGEYTGKFLISNISLYSYQTYGENRTAIGIVINQYWLDDVLMQAAKARILPNSVKEEGDASPVLMNDVVKPTLVEETTIKPIEDSEINRDEYTSIVIGGVEIAKTRHNVINSDQPQENSINQEKVAFLRSFDCEWEYGKPYKVDTTLSRQEILNCRHALIALGYRFDALKQLYVVGGNDSWLV